MRIFTRIDGSICGAILSCRPPPAVTSKPSSPSICSTTRDEYRNPICSGVLAVTGRKGAAPNRRKRNGFSAVIFSRRVISTVATSGSRLLSSTHSNQGFFSYSRRWNHAVAEVAGGIRPKQELLDIVGQYEDTSVEDHLEFLRDPYLRRYAPADGPRLSVSNRREDVNLQSVDSRHTTDPEIDEIVRKLQKAVLLKLRRPGRADLDAIYDLFQSLPEPRASHITSQLRHQLFAVLSRTERKDYKSMLRYFSVVTDVRNSGFPLTTFEWNTAMSFASRYVGRSTDVEVESALHLWREMERVSGVRASDVTFNILFDVASKAGKLHLAEMVYQEMISRGYQFNRYHHVSLIHYFGLKQDSGGVRAAYKEMVESGEVIDSTVLNCVISGFLASGEEDSAMRVYDKMKSSAKTINRIPPNIDYTMQKNITKVLMMFAKIAKRHPEMQPNFQQAAVTSPNLQTYRLLVNHFGPKLGDLSTVAQLLDEMKSFNLPLHGAIFLALFKAFGKHGGPGSDWSTQRLINVWGAFLDALDAQSDGLYISTWVAMAILRAFSRSATRDEILDIYENLRSRWDLDAANSQFMMEFLRKLMKQRGFYV
ncbi:uncharacterized protein F4822DRAFT_238882 [Hypoxylon trugodes]|uniref:uncharacterized protein n=1 Tax=Hypoxylon trugodes TaxID=326681 RepID=UPI00219F447B|nr:uncharacterized protein F4822DRAFT_238882 [Hypoxylon trugodes]KAI1388224.1 hypothetical protein F4822DRAFT_238882 [Hypoxylon trugodes]